MYCRRRAAEYRPHQAKPLTSFQAVPRRAVGDAALLAEVVRAGLLGPGAAAGARAGRHVRVRARVRHR